MFDRSPYMNLASRNRMQTLLEEAIKILYQSEGTEIAREEIRSDLNELLLGREKLAFTMKELSDKVSIPVKTLYYYEKQGLLQTTNLEKGNKIVSREDALNFLKSLKAR